MAQFGRILLFLGLGVAAVGGLLMLGSHLGLGRLPGDLTFKGKQTTVYFPLATSIVLSLVLTVLLNLFLSRR